MFANLSQKITQTFRTLSGTANINEAMLEKSSQEIKRALQEADVANGVINELLAVFKQKTLGSAINPNISAADMLMKEFYDTTVKILGDDTQHKLHIDKKPSTIMLVGLQGAGKTTFAARLAKYLIQQKKKPLLVSCDVYRPAAMEQLRILAQQADCLCYPSQAQDDPMSIVSNAQASMQEQGCDVLIVDTAGRMHVDADMMAESKAIKQLLQPQELLFVLDSMTGQDAAHTAKAFHDELALTGCILTKTDGDSRGGAALSVRHITGKPIKFVTTGEKLQDIDSFEPERIAQQILGMGDMVGLLRKFEQHIDKDKAQKMVQKITKTGQFDFQDLRDQLQQMQSMGGMESIMKNLPGMNIPPQMLEEKLASKSTAPILHMIDSMTMQERYFPQLVINVASRKRRILKGSGRSAQEFNDMLKQFKRMQKMMKKFKGNNMQKMMQKMSSMMGGKNFLPGD